MINVVFVYSDIIPENIINKIVEENNDDININIEKRISGPYACIEVLIPTAFILFILKPYTESFLSEMGKDHYEIIAKLIKNTAKKFIGKDKIVPIKVITSTDSPKKTGKYSIAFSVMLKISEKYRIKFLFEESLSINEIEEYSNRIVQFITNNRDEEILNIIIANKNILLINTALFTYDKRRKEIILLNLKENILKEGNNELLWNDKKGIIYN